MSAERAIEEAFAALAAQPGFQMRDQQRQLSQLIHDCLLDQKSGLFEAPTGSGKSLGNLIPAIAHAIYEGKRTVISTYTNILAEQYWYKDLQMALSLFPEHQVTTAYLIGRSRYLCLQSAHEMNPRLSEAIIREADLGIESEFRGLKKLPVKSRSETWRDITAPSVCEGKLCQFFQQCYFFKARRAAERAKIVITNHSLVLQDAMLRAVSMDELDLLGNYHALIMDEAHDVFSAATSAFESEISERKIGILQGMVRRLVSGAERAVPHTEFVLAVNELAAGFNSKIRDWVNSLNQYLASVSGQAVLQITPEILGKHPDIEQIAQKSRYEIAESLIFDISESVNALVRTLEWLLENAKSNPTVRQEDIEKVEDLLAIYVPYLKSWAVEVELILQRRDPSVTLAEHGRDSSRICNTMIDVAGVLRDLVWSKRPTICTSATLSLDGCFDFFVEKSGFDADHKEILPSPFDFEHQAALYLPKEDRIPDGSEARRNQTETQYFETIASELSEIINSAGGRTMALFHSRREMEEVARRIRVPGELEILLQPRTGAAMIAKKFLSSNTASLFALRSFWTGFDAPGSTLSCVVIVRLPFEVPTDTLSLARRAWYESIGENSFRSWSLPNTKMLVRQGVGRLIRRTSDKGVVCILDPRVRTKNYGIEILENVPKEIRTFTDFRDAMGWVKLESSLSLDV